MACTFFIAKQMVPGDLNQRGRHGNSGSGNTRKPLLSYTKRWQIERVEYEGVTWLQKSIRLVSSDALTALHQPVTPN
jgi:hypothetical protein